MLIDTLTPQLHTTVLLTRITDLEAALATVTAERDEMREQLDGLVWLDDPLPPMRFDDTEHGLSA